MSVSSHLRSTYFNPNFSIPQRRSLFPGFNLSTSPENSNSPSTLLNFQSAHLVNPNFQQTKEENTSLELSESEEESLGRKRRAVEQELTQQQVSNYLLQSSVGALPASHASVPANFWMVANPGNSQVMSGDPPVWTFPTVNNSAPLYRGTMSSGLHFMNFPTAVALLPSQQFGIGGGGGSGGGGGVAEGHFGMLAGLNPYSSSRAFQILLLCWFTVSLYSWDFKFGYHLGLRGIGDLACGQPQTL